jgi:hypothetical protein
MFFFCFFFFCFFFLNYYCLKIRKQRKYIEKSIFLRGSSLQMSTSRGLARAVSAMGFKVQRPKFKPKSKFLALSKSARDTKGKGLLVCPADQPKVLKVKEGPGSRPPSALAGSGASPSRAESLPGLDAGIFTPGASSSRLVPSLVPVVGNPSSADQSRTPMVASPTLVLLGAKVSAAQVSPP